MDFNDFKKEFQSIPIINSSDIVRKYKGQTAYNQLNTWTKKGLLIQLKRGLYILNKDDRKIAIGNYFIANQLYQPSYISMESALSLYELIPDTTAAITSISTKKTMTIDNPFASFTYQHIKSKAYRGFKLEIDNNNLNYFIAEPEKAILDFLYFNLSDIDRQDTEIFEKSYRFQNLDILDAKKILKYADFFDNPKLKDAAKNLCMLIKGVKC
ncbi:MAG: hypothetical protein LBN20_04565 [Endomicrobium sp.]|jgi:hypothetical protein|nr:hypothetical protein [Endomicrobium sp.]